MALEQGSIFGSDAAGSTETIALQAIPSTNPLQVTIASAFYGVDASGAPIPVQLPQNHTTVTFKMLAGINTLTITLTSPDPRNQAVNIVQGNTILATPIVKNHSGFSSIFLQGV